MARRMAVMSMGRVQQVAEPRHVYRRPANLFVAEFMGEANMLPGELREVSDGLGTVETPLGSLVAALGEPAPGEGDEVVCMVRPECLKTGSGEPNALRARLEDSVYLGEVEQLKLTCAGLELSVMNANPGPSPPTVGDEVALHFDPDDAVILPQTSREQP